MQILKWIGIVLAAIIVVAIIAGGTLHFMGNNRLANAPDVEVTVVTVPSDAVAIARGEHLVHAVGVCSECHGENLEGTAFIDEAPIGYLPAPNLTSGQGGIGSAYTDEDWVRALRHGIGYDGRTLGAMPSHWYTHMDDTDLGAMIAYLKQISPLDNDLGPRRIQFPGTILFGVLGYNTMPVAQIDHTNVGGVKPPEGATAEYGEYLSKISLCQDCHAANLAGNTDPNGPPMGPNITPGGALAGYNEAQFLSFMRSGVTPGGYQVSDEMPWMFYQGLSDEEIQALWVYLSGLEALPNNE